MKSDRWERPCPACGVPLITRSLLTWRNNGTITLSSQDTFRALVLRHSQIDAVRRFTGGQVMNPFTSFLYEEMRRSSQRLFDSVFDSIPFLRISLKRKSPRVTAVNFLNATARLMGQCLSVTHEYVPGEHARGTVKNPFYMPAMAAYITGAFEALEQLPFDCTWEQSGEETYEVTVFRRKTERFLRPVPRENRPAPLPGANIIERCPKCNSPVALANWSWNMDTGIITDTRDGSRIILVDARTINGVMRSMSERFSEAVDYLMLDLHREWKLEQLKARHITPVGRPLSRKELFTAYRSRLDTLAVEGQGNPVSIVIEGPLLTVTVENPYNNYLIAGELRAYYETFNLVEQSTVTWHEQRQGIVKYTVGPVGLTPTPGGTG